MSRISDSARLSAAARHRPRAIIAAGSCAAGNAENVVLAVPNVALTFAPGYLAEDWGLFAKQGLNVKSVVITGIGSANAVISGSADFAEISGATLTRAAARGQRMVGIVEHAQPAHDPDRPAQGDCSRSGFRSQGAARQARAASARPHHRGRFHQLRDPCLCAAAGAAGRLQSRRHPHCADGAEQRNGGIPDRTGRRLRNVDAVAAAARARRQRGGGRQRLGRRPRDMYPFGHNVFVAKPETCERRKSACAKLGKALAEAIARMLDRPTRRFRFSRSASRRSTKSCSPPALPKSARAPRARRSSPRPTWRMPSSTTSAPAC